MTPGNTEKQENILIFPGQKLQITASKAPRNDIVPIYPRLKILLHRTNIPPSAV